MTDPSHRKFDQSKASWHFADLATLLTRTTGLADIVRPSMT